MGISRGAKRYVGLIALFLVALTLAACGTTSESDQQQDQAEKSSTKGEATEAGATGGETGAGGMESGMMAEDIPRFPPVKAYYGGEEVFFIHPEASNHEIADLLTEMMGSPVLVVPELGEIPDEALSKVYVFTNGVEGDGPLGFQPDVFSSAPGDPGYSPLRRLYMVTWKDESQARVLKSLSEVKEAREEGEITIERRDVVINEPFVTWPGGER